MSLPFQSLVPIIGRILLLRYEPRLPICLLDYGESEGESTGSGGNGIDSSVEQ